MNGEELKAKAELAASVFGTLCKEKGTGVMEHIVKLTIDTTNDIWEGIQNEG